MTVAARGGWSIGWLIAAPLVVVAPEPAAAQTRPGTAPGTAIVNVAAVTQGEATTPSNTVVVAVAERLDVALDRAADAAPPGGPAIGVTLVNRGSGEEAFVVGASVAGGSAAVGPIEAAGAPLAGGRTPPLAPGATLVLRIPVSAVEGDPLLVVTARAASGSGAPGTAFAGLGDGGSDAVVGTTGAAAQLSIALADAAPPVLAKSQTVLAPDGGETPVRGAVVTYTLTARFAAATDAADLADPIPAGTAYLPGSLTLDGAPLADAGHVAAGTIGVALGPVAAGAVRILRFKVVIS